MSSSGGTSGTPVGGGVVAPTSSLLAQPLPYTLLSLSKFAKILGINPVHFFSAEVAGTNPLVMPINQSCQDLWVQYAWQDMDKVSRYDIAFEIQAAEEDISRILGYYPAPMWINEEQHPYPRPFNREYFGTGRDVRLNMKAIETDHAKIVGVGKRAITALPSAATTGGGLTYSDEDGDGFYETATVTVPTTLTNVNEIKVYHTGYAGQLEWEIREPRRKYITGGYVYLIFDSWLFIDPDLFEVFTTEDGFRAIDITATTNFVTQVDVYREHVDTTDISAKFYWENEFVGCASCGGAGCEACGHITQDGCLRVRDEKVGLVVPIPASYSDGDWGADNWSGSREPDKVNIWYYAGEQSSEYLRGQSPSPLSNFWAEVIAWIVTARLDRPLCSCGTVSDYVIKMQLDTSKNTREGTFFNPPELISNPLGPRVGEMLAWRRIRTLGQRVTSVAVI